MPSTSTKGEEEEEETTKKKNCRTTPSSSLDCVSAVWDLLPRRKRRMWRMAVH